MVTRNESHMVLTYGLLLLLTMVSRALLTSVSEQREISVFLIRSYVEYTAETADNLYTLVCLFVCLFLAGKLQWTRASSFTRFLDHTQQCTTVGRTPRRRDLYLTTHNTHNCQIFVPPVRFEPTISAGEWPQAYALDRTATGTGVRSGTRLKCL